MSQYIAAGFLNAIMPVNILAMLLSVTIGICLVFLLQWVLL